MINIDVDKAVLTDRFCGRRSCVECCYTAHISALNGSACPKCGCEMVQRMDDREDTVRDRLRVYEEQTAPLIEYYGAKGILVNVDGMGSPEEVFAEIGKVLG